MVLYDNSTLMIRHFPPEVPKEDKINFMKHFGATEVKCLESRNKKSNLIFAKFQNKTVAESVLKKLHQIELFGQLLSVEFTRDNLALNSLPPEKSRAEDLKEDGGGERKLYDLYIQKLNNWTGEVKLEQPPPLHLKYVYPPPGREAIANIAAALAVVPKFYTQVLHLMNKMNLPCPFMDPYPIRSELGNFAGVKNTEDKAVGTKDTPTEEGEDEEVEEEESEMESDGEGAGEGEVVPPKRARKGVGLRRGKLVRWEGAAPGRARLRPDQVFDLPPPPKRIELRLSSTLRPPPPLDLGEATGFDKMEPPPDAPGPASSPCSLPQEEPPLPAVISLQELTVNTISPRDQHLLPVFKNYQPGLPSCRLYIKNLAKNVTERDLHYIYRRYLLEDVPQEQGSMFDIRLMQEGRMKGQAFVSLQSSAQAELARAQTNGYILKGKPMVVHFARSAKSK